MNFEIIPIKEHEKEILRNLMEKYDYEFTQYTHEDVNPLGLYGYSRIDHYWTDPGRWAFFLKVDGNLAGFAMVIDYPEAGKTDYNMAEFFVMYKDRRCGLGSFAAARLFGLFPGSWQIKYHPKNVPSAEFWNRIAEKHSQGGYRREERPDLAYPDGAAAQVLFFETVKVVAT